MYCINTLGMTH